MKIGIVGFGQLGQLAARHMAAHAEVVVTDVDSKLAARAALLGVQFASLVDVCACGVVVVAVPVPAMRAVLAEMAPLLAAGTLVVDVASVKCKPVAWMLELLPEQVEIVATHPLFGPQSGKNGIAGLKMVVCKVRGERHAVVAAFAREKLGLEVIETTPEEHDKEMAYVQALSHLIGRALARMEIPDEQLRTKSYQHLLEMKDLLKDDTVELFYAIQRDNPFAADVTQKFLGEIQALLA